jgi:hypothetical protein
VGFMRDQQAEEERDRMLSAYRAQLHRAGDSEYRAAVLLMWQGHAGVSRDDLAGVLREVEEGRGPEPLPRPGAVQKSPFT